MENNKQKPNKVEELYNFPFTLFSELKKAFKDNTVTIGVERGTSLKWALNGNHQYSSLRNQVRLWMYLPFFVPIVFVIYIIIAKTWLLFIALPVMLIGFFIFHPSAARISSFLGLLRLGFIAFIFIALIWGLINGTGWLISISLSLAVIWFSENMAYIKANNGIIKAVLEHEDLLCWLWDAKVLRVGFTNGDNYGSDMKEEGGKYVYYS